MLEEVIDILKEINSNLEEIKKKESLPRVIKAKEISETYKVGLNAATEFCKKYGTKIGGYGIEQDKFKELLQSGVKIA